MSQDELVNEGHSKRQELLDLLTHDAERDNDTTASMHLLMADHYLAAAAHQAHRGVERLGTMASPTVLTDLARTHIDLAKAKAMLGATL